MPTARPTYPPAERLDQVDELHGEQVADPYRWLEDTADPRTVEWSTAQDELLAQRRATWPTRARFAARLGELLATGSVSAPIWRAGRPFFLRRTGEQQLSVLLTIDGDGDGDGDDRDGDGRERVLIDPMALDPSGATTLDYWYPSADGGFLAYGLSHGGTEESLLRVMDVGSGTIVDGPIDRARYAQVAWLSGGEGFYYMRHLGGDDHLSRRVYLHRLGTDAGTDPLVFGGDSPRGRYFGCQVSTDGRWFAVSESQGTDPRTNVWIADLHKSPVDAPEFLPLQVDVDALTTVDLHDGHCYIWTDRDAPRRRLCVTEPDRLAYEDWRELLPEDPEAVLEDVAILDGPELDRPVVVARRSRHAVSELAVHCLATGEHLADVPLPGVGSVVELTAPPTGAHSAWFTYTDFTTPATVYRFDARTQEIEVWASPPGEVELPALSTRQVMYRSKDGTEVRMFLIEGAGHEGPRPTVLYGYGGFNIAMTPSYSTQAVAWVEAGGVYAIANLRGGSEEGEQWHRAGMLANKQNVFDDFAAAADWLVYNGLSTPEQLGIFGGSNGGLLVGAALTQHPEKFAAVVCSAPLLDMIRYEQFGLGTTWSGEYGTVEVAEEFGWLISYSPYHNVREGLAYPAVLFTVFEGDTRVDPLHARKLAAALQHATGGARPILVRRETEVGHSSRAVSRSIDLYADELAFLSAETGLA
jgi:prolyl oligopeptidase